ncbi:hypothetical protein [Nocardia lasii]|uniref:PASTA domain-containing protein n=1 Tax=Nocardia lasii TaxID=1616107 RepID=A0ABW1JXF4_9NOCA
MRYVLAAVIGVSTLTGCSTFVDEGPTDQQIAEASGVTVAEAGSIVTTNFHRVWPERTDVAVSNVALGAGCRTDPDTLRAVGPPWTPHHSRTVIDPSPELIDQLLANLEALTASGFTLVPDPVPGDDPVNRTYEDARGFSVGAQRHATSREVRFSITASSPCARE